MILDGMSKMPELSDEAKEELKNAIAIVRSDKQYSMVRDIHSRTGEPKSPTAPTGKPADPGKKDPAVPPPAKPEPPEGDKQTKKRGIWSLGNDEGESSE
jgi:hypothetical protein